MLERTLPAWLLLLWTVFWLIRVASVTMWPSKEGGKMRAYQFDYTTTAYGRSRRGTKRIDAYCFTDAVDRLHRHASRKWVDGATIYIHGAMVDGVFVNPDIIGLANAEAVHK